MAAKKKNIPKIECVYVPCHARNVEGPPYWLSQSMSAIVPTKTVQAIATLPARGKNPLATANDASA